MNQKWLLGAGLVLLVALCGTAFWLGRSSSSATSVIQTPPAPPSAPKVPAAIDVEPSLRVGARIEALSTEGWMPATIREISADQALIRYERAALGEERVDIRLIRKPESELVMASAPPAPGPNPAAAPSVPPAPVLGPRPSSEPLPLGTYDCDGSRDVVILDDHQYGAFGEETGNYTFDAATLRIQWTSGPLAGNAAKYVADPSTIVTSMGGQALACTLRR